MAVISPREEQIFREMTCELSPDPRRDATDPRPTAPVRLTFGAKMRLRRVALLGIWLVSLLGSFGMAEGRVPMVACALSLACATFAIWSDFVASLASWTRRST